MFDKIFLVSDYMSILWKPSQIEPKSSSIFQKGTSGVSAQACEISLYVSNPIQIYPNSSRNENSQKQTSAVFFSSLDKSKLVSKEPAVGRSGKRCLGQYPQSHSKNHAVGGKPPLAPFSKAQVKVTTASC